MTFKLLFPNFVSLQTNNKTFSNTVNVEIFAHYIFLRISRMVSYAQKYDVSENLNHYRLDRIRYKMRENMTTRKGHIWLDARKFSCAKISTFTVIKTSAFRFLKYIPVVLYSRDHASHRQIACGKL